MGIQTEREGEPAAGPVDTTLRMWEKMGRIHHSTRTIKEQDEN